MTHTRPSTTLSAAVAVFLALSAACAADEAPGATPTVAPPEQQQAVPDDASPTALAATDGYDPRANMFEIFSGPGHSPDATLVAFERARANGDVSQVPVIIEIMRFFATQEFADAANLALTSLTGHTVPRGFQEWNDWMVWLGENRSGYRPPDGYVEWKVNLLKIIDPRFVGLLGQAEQTSRVDMTEVVWGGVKVDGIPDLQNSPTIEADEADYLLDDDAVFGVSINGEHRAYPLRILNPHEMANDVLGGEPIALAY